MKRFDIYDIAWQCDSILLTLINDLQVRKSDMIKQVLSILNRGEKIKLVILFFMVGLGSILELLGVSAFSPLINLITDPSIINT